MRNTKNAFTLVELIVVITILAILGTIAFISLQGYSADARNSKRTSDIGNIQSAISLKQVEGVSLMSFVTSKATTKLSGIALAGAATVDTTKYDAGTPSYTVLNVVAKDFKDPQGDNEYRIGVSTYKAGVFQVAATIEVDGTDTALVNGTYVARATTQTGTVSGTAGEKVITLGNAQANLFKAGDYITIAADGGTLISATNEITKVSRDGVTLTLTNDLTGSTGTGTVNISISESAGLIADDNTTTAATTTDAVTNLSTTALAY